MVTDKAALQVQLNQTLPIPLNINLTCGRGELLALTGPSGSGKTTVLRCIAGLQKVAAGKIICNDAVWLDSQQGVSLKAQHRRVGFVFQQYALFPHMTALDNVMTAMNHVKRGDRRNRARELLAITNMSGLDERLPQQLSGGQRQRVALARALAREPEVLLMDEPFSAVDQQTRQRLYLELAQLRTELQLPMILVTHDMSEVSQLADSICLIHRGNTLQSGNVLEVNERPASVAAARLLGHQNLFAASVIEASGQSIVLDILGTTLNAIPGPNAQAARIGEKVTALLPSSAVIMHRRDRPSRGERENPVTGSVSETVALGDDLLVKLHCNGPDEPLSFRLSRHVAARNKVAVGETLSVSVLKEAIHLIAEQP